MFRHEHNRPGVGGRGSARATIEVHHFFLRLPSISELQNSRRQKQITRKLKRPHPMKKSFGLGTRREKHAKHVAFFFPRRFWVKEPRRSEIIFAKKRYTLIPLSYIHLSARRPRGLRHEGKAREIS